MKIEMNAYASRVIDSIILGVCIVVVFTQFVSCIKSGVEAETERKKARYQAGIVEGSETLTP